MALTVKGKLGGEIVGETEPTTVKALQVVPPEQEAEEVATELTKPFEPKYDRPCAIPLKVRSARLVPVVVASKLPTVSCEVVAMRAVPLELEVMMEFGAK